ncbi:acyltransferase [Bordetella genomosp. 9]|uniref:OpgC domain-containing protein n=1 Tax=Bordetella genomosp. 9 TaxID=1416803 RepID=UPI000A296C39|nr:OpgC domain-containing protein [Bordetella genomosp. 9]ARP89465.1 acyltransferase [Bordetella genomosp. 9]
MTTPTSPCLPRSPLTAAAGTAAAGRSRLWELDALRGLMLVLMLSTHLPTNFGIPTSQPLGFVSAAEGFVMLSAYMAGLVYTQRYLRHGLRAMQQSFLKRALVVYGCQAASLLFLFTVIAGLGVKLSQPAVQNLIWFYLQQPVTAFFSALGLIYNPPLLDILPVYVLFMLASPWVLTYGLRHGWRAILILSGVLWFATQFELSRFLYGGVVALTGLPVPFRETGAFETFGWQFLWVFGLWLGSTHARVPPAERRPLPAWLAAGATVVGVTFLIWRHIAGLSAFPEGNPFNFLFDKWHLGPLRLLNFFSLVVLVMVSGPWLRRHLPRLGLLETLGRASLSVFCAHLVIVLMVLCVIGEPGPDRALWKDLALFAGSVGTLYVVARLVGDNKSRRPPPRTASVQMRGNDPLP